MASPDASDAVIPPSSRLRRFWHAARWPLFAFVAAVALILAMTWPWCLHWRGEFLNHWDPPFHAWKLEYMARRILAGDLFCSLGGTGNTNMLYPQSGALYFEALQWPPALFAAGLFALTPLPSETVYHITLLLFWALSAPCMFALLRELRCSRLASLAGSLVFCILPHRMSYCVEFQMELIFAMPLVYLFFLRFFRRGRAFDAVALAVSWWILAVSELYEAVFVLMSLPVLALAFLAARPRVLAERRFWLGGLAAGAAGVVLLPAMLLPYLTQQSEGTVSRPLREVVLHSAQPLSYLLPWGRFRPWSLDARMDELSLYPTLAVLLLAAAAAFIWVRRDWAAARCPLDTPALPAWRRVFRRVPPVLHSLAPLFALLFAGFVFTLYFGWHDWRKTFAGRTVFCFNAGLWCLPFLLLLPCRNESSRMTFLRGFAVVAFLACALSFGPWVSVGPSLRQLLGKFDNAFYVNCYRNWLPFIANFRVVSRFGVLVLFFLVCTATVAADLLSRRLRRPLSRAALPVLLVAVCVLESIPPAKTCKVYRRVDPMRDHPVVQRLLAERPPCTLAAVPVSLRELEGMRMFSLLKGDFPYVYVWGGYFTDLAQEITGAFTHNLRDLWRDDLASLYPPVLVLADHAATSHVFRVHEPYAPGESFLGPTGSLHVHLDPWLAPVAVPVARDDRFSLHVLRPLPPAPRVLKRVRTDVALLNPVLDATAVFDNPAAAVPLNLFLGDRLCGTFEPDGAGTIGIHFDLSSIPRSDWSKSLPNLIEFVAGDGSPDAPAFRLDAFSLLTPDGLYRDPCTGRDLDPAAFPSPDAPWN